MSFDLPIRFSARYSPSLSTRQRIIMDGATTESNAPNPSSRKRRKTSGVTIGGKNKPASLSLLPDLSVDILYEVSPMFLDSIAI